MILITGSAGYIGSHISCYFEQKKIKYLGIDNLKYSYRSNVPNKKKFFQIDISNLKNVEKLIYKYKIKTIIHTAAFSYVLEGEHKKHKYYTNNIIKTKKFIEICKKCKIENFIFLSSSNVYKEKKLNNSYVEINNTIPKNFYGKNKIMIEKFLKNKFKKLIIFRLFNVVGIFNDKFKMYKFNKKNYQRLLFKIIQNISNGKTTEINYIKDRKKIKKIFPSRDFIEIIDVVKIIEKSINKVSLMNKFYKIINVGTGIDISIDKIVAEIKASKVKKLKIKFKEISNKEFSFTKSNIKKLIRFTGIKPKLNLKRVIKSHLN